MALILPRCSRRIDSVCGHSSFSSAAQVLSPSYLRGTWSVASNNVTEVKPAGHRPQLLLQPKSMWGPWASPGRCSSWDSGQPFKECSAGACLPLKAAELAGQAVNTRVLSCRIQWQQQEFPHLATLNLDFGHCCWLPTAKPSLLDSSVGVFSFLAGSRLLYVRFSSYG